MYDEEGGRWKARERETGAGWIYDKEPELIEESTLGKSETTGDCIFFCGTLLPQYVPSEMRGVVAPLRFLEEGSVRGMLYDFGEYPGAILDETSDKRVYGAVFQLPGGSRILDELDRYEGYDPANFGSCLFVRRRCPVEVSDGSVIECWVYEYNGNPQGVPIIASGRYRKDDAGVGV